MDNPRRPANDDQRRLNNLKPRRASASICRVRLPAFRSTSRVSARHDQRTDGVGEGGIAPVGARWHVEPSQRATGPVVLAFTDLNHELAVRDHERGQPSCGMHIASRPWQKRTGTGQPASQPARQAGIVGARAWLTSSGPHSASSWAGRPPALQSPSNRATTPLVGLNVHRRSLPRSAHHAPDPTRPSTPMHCAALAPEKRIGRTTASCGPQTVPDSAVRLALIAHSTLAAGDRDAGSVGRSFVAGASGAPEVRSLARL